MAEPGRNPDKGKSVGKAAVLNLSRGKREELSAGLSRGPGITAQHGDSWLSTAAALALPLSCCQSRRPGRCPHAGAARPVAHWHAPLFPALSPLGPALPVAS